MRALCVVATALALLAPTAAAAEVSAPTVDPKKFILMPAEKDPVLPGDQTLLVREHGRSPLR
jgi:hypothetical protein